MDDASSPPGPSALARSLGLVAEDLAELVVLGERVQALITRMAAASGPRDATLLVDAQAADLLSQRLTGLTTFVHALADAERHADYARVEAAIGALTLADQHRRFAGGAAAALPPDAGGKPTFWD